MLGSLPAAADGEAYINTVMWNQTIPDELREDVPNVVEVR
jgi:hypothetical protein